jgi:quinol-cytochrome oxidoreductase complex cytochrome b subunit
MMTRRKTKQSAPSNPPASPAANSRPDSATAPAPPAISSAAGQKRGGFANLVLHLHPRQVPAAALRLTLTFGLGGAAVVLLLLLVATGVLLLFVYEPSQEAAYASIQALRNDVLFGQFIRNIHHWSGNLLLVVAVLHLLRVFLTGAFRPPRALNWIVGLVLLLLVVASNFTGYLLPWDQLAYWAVTISTGMLEYLPLAGKWLQVLVRRGSEIGPATLATFFALHIAILPILSVFLMMFHFWQVRKSGGVILRPADTPDSRPPMVPVSPHLTRREGAAALVLLAAVCLLAALANAPLELQANPGMSPNPAKAPWYFMGLQELLIHFHPFVAVFLLPLLAAAALVLLPYLRYETTPGGRWFHSPRGARLGLRSALVALAVTPLAVLADEFLPDLRTLLPGVPELVTGGLIPVALLVALAAALFAFLRRRGGYSLHETVQALGIAAAVILLVLTVIGIFFRGQGMALVWPWARQLPPS